MTADGGSAARWRSAWTRLYTTLLMLAGFALLIRLGHIPLMLLVFVCQLSMFRELKRLSRVLSSKRELPSARPLHWYWFATAVFFCYGKMFDYYFHIRTPYHTFLSFSLYCLGVLLFVFSLRQGYYKYQFETFAWIHLTLLLIVVQSTFIVLNMFHGLVWFILPCTLIIGNDCFAYVVGSLIGRTPLIRLSPKKTWEGFLGAALLTVVTGCVLASVMAQFPSMTCPKTDLSFTSPPACVTPPVFTPQPYRLPDALLAALQWLLPAGLQPPHIVQVSAFQLHALTLSVFASLIAPFGGFFASGFKRAFHIKDFGESIPGHGGVTDRMDCQVLMGFFVWVYYTSFVVKEGGDERWTKLLKLLDRMELEELQRLYFFVGDALVHRGVQLVRAEL